MLKILNARDRCYGRPLRSIQLAAVLLILCGFLMRATAAAAEKFQADEWVTECAPGTRTGTPDCAITVPFWQSHGTPKGSFALVIMVETGNIGIVGELIQCGRYFASTSIHPRSVVNRATAFSQALKRSLS